MRRCNHGFTWIELTVSVTVVVMLGSVLCLAAGAARRRGKDTLCLANLGRIAQASITYSSEDPDEQAIPIGPQNLLATNGWSLTFYAWGGKSGVGDTAGPDADTSRWGTARDMGPAARPLNRVLYGQAFPDYKGAPGWAGRANRSRDARLDLSIYRCPSDSGYTGLHFAGFRDSSLTSFDHYGTSYAAANLWTYWTGGCPCYLSSSGAYLQRLTAIVSPSRTLAYMENCGSWAYLAAPQPSGCGDGMEGTVHGWHGKDWVFNVAFVDGHCAPVHIQGFRAEHIERYPRPSGIYDQYKCTMVRGDGWQLDTLPLEPVLTDIPCNKRAAGEDADVHDRAQVGDCEGGDCALRAFVPWDALSVGAGS